MEFNITESILEFEHKEESDKTKKARSKLQKQLQKFDVVDLTAQEKKVGDIFDRIAKLVHERTPISKSNTMDLFDENRTPAAPSRKIAEKIKHLTDENLEQSVSK